MTKPTVSDIQERYKDDLACLKEIPSLSEERDWSVIADIGILLEEIERLHNTITGLQGSLVCLREDYDEVSQKLESIYENGL